MTDKTPEAVDRHIHCIDPHGMAHPASLNDRTIKLLRALAAENAALRADNDRLRGALRPFADQAYTFDSPSGEFVPDRFQPAIIDHTIGDLRRARAAIQAKP